MKDLIERLEKATGPDRDIDGAVQRATNGRVLHIGCGGLTNAFTASIDAARMLVPDGHDITITQASGPDRTDWYATCKERDDWGRKPLHRGNACSGATALCIAALKARAAITTSQRAEK